eukprot:scaffold19910_cov145-Isochrysis_galbana.AAC.3
MRHALRSDELGPGRELLADHAGDGEHGEPAVVDLLGGHLLVLGRRGRFQAERVETEVAGLVVRADRPWLAAEWRVEGEDGEHLHHGDGDDHGGPEGLQRGLLERDVGRYIDRATKERMELLADEEAERRKHRDAAVLQLHL